MLDIRVETTEKTASQYSIRCFLEGEEAGSCLCTVYWNGKANAMLVDGVLVREDHRRKGYGSLLMESAVKLARKLGVDSVELTVNPDNVVARSLYRKMGFAETDKKYCRRILNRWTSQQP